MHGSINMLGLAKRVKAKILQASTSEVYGHPEVHSLEESYWGRVNPIGPRSCYDEGKRCAETLFLDYRRQHNLSIKVARIFNTYGPRMQAHDGRVVSNFIVQALTGRPISIFGDGKQTRSFCYVGNPVEFTIMELAETIIEPIGSKSSIEFKPLPMDDPRQRQPGIGRARDTLGWSPSVQPREGLSKTIVYFDNLLRKQCDGAA
ncbi:hypothetical protein GCM10007857_77690 [Bradyrhizobium iriomotense]|uniref:NAD-dependent epimerase/dehydratase domain-containing protein n=1 Tax=Bradyrhizobium iriomotense TaxID=441950 RepID=A0ABQ6BBA4_9BRAD|nr:hypothetical protein GCM10007857_77690 [Bradyrhizobium iriomotense]